MGVFRYATLKVNVTAPEAEAILRQVTAKLWPDKYRIERTSGVPVTPADNRVAKWEFWPEGWTGDGAFTISLMADRRLECKVPRSQFDEWYHDQSRVRRALARRINAPQLQG